MLHQLLVDDAVGRADDRRRVLAAREQRDRELGGDEKAHLLAVDAARDVDADDVAFLVERRAAAHAGRERAAEEDLRIEAAPHQAVVGALRDREADVERIAERVDALALRERLAGRAKRQRVEALARRVGGAQQREVVQHVELQDHQRRLAAVGGDVDQVVAIGLQRGLADDVEVGDDVALRADEEARADRGLAGAALQHGADLDQLRARLLVDLARRERDRRGRRRRWRRRCAALDGGGAAGAPAPVADGSGEASGVRNCASADDAASASTPKAAQRLTRTLIRADSTVASCRHDTARAAATVVRAATAAEPNDGDSPMQRRRLIRAALAGSAALALPAIGRAQAAREAQADDRRRRQEPALLPAADRSPRCAAT